MKNILKTKILKLTIFIAAVLGLGVFALSPEAQAADFYIRPTADGGSDSHQCMNATTDACATLNYVQGKMSAGDTVYIRGGTYLGTFNVEWYLSGISTEKPTVIMAYQNEIPIFDSRNAANFVMRIGNSPNKVAFVTINGIYFTNGIKSGNSVNLVNVDYIVVRNCKFFDVGTDQAGALGGGADPWTASNILVENNIFFNNGCPEEKCPNQPHGDHSIYFSTHFNNVIIRNNLFERGTGSGVSLKAGSADDVNLGPNTAQVYNNVFINNYSGITTYNSQNIHIFNNTFYNNSFGIWVSSWSIMNIISENNLLWLGAGNYAYDTEESKLQYFLTNYNLIYALNNGDIARNRKFIGGESPWLYEYLNFSKWKAKTNKDLNSIQNDPLFINPSNPFGPDGKLWTADDGFRLSVDNPACGAGINGGDIGAYSCINPADVNVDNQVNIKDIQICIKAIVDPGSFDPDHLDQLAKCQVVAPPDTVVNIKDIQAIIHCILDPQCSNPTS